MAVISVVILCYKAGNEIPGFVTKVRNTVERITLDWEIVLVGNYHTGEQDTTPDIVRDFASTDDRYIPITLEKQGMMGWDARCGLRVATGNFIVIIDGDNQMPPEDIEHVYNKLISGNFDMAMTYRSNRHDGWIRRSNSRIFNLLFRLLFPGYPVVDVNSKPKIFTRELFDKFTLCSDDWFLDTEIVIQARRHKAHLGQIPTVFYRSMNRKSFVRIDAISEFVKNLIVARFKEFFY